MLNHFSQKNVEYFESNLTKQSRECLRVCPVDGLKMISVFHLLWISVFVSAHGEHSPITFYRAKKSVTSTAVSVSHPACCVLPLERCARDFKVFLLI